MSQTNKNFFFHLALVFIVLFLISSLKYSITTVPVLGFHGISDPKNSTILSERRQLDYPKQDLEKILEHLIINDYWFLTSQDLYDFFLTRTKKIPSQHLHQKPIMISFDDGYKTVYTNLLPILEKLEEKHGQKVKVVLFINPGTLATPESIASTHLGCQELRAGLKKGFYDIQSHGLNHKNLTKLAPHELVNELLQSQIQLRACTKDLDSQRKVASHFAYPYGATNKQVEHFVSKYYLSSYLYNDKILNYDFLSSNYKIPRLAVNQQKNFSNLIEIAEKSDKFWNFTSGKL